MKGEEGVGDEEEEEVGDEDEDEEDGVRVIEDEKEEAGE